MEYRRIMSVVVSSLQSGSVRVSSDHNTCAINGLCKIPGGTFAAVDCTNNTVKLLNNSLNSVLHSYCMEHLTPHDVCHTSGREIAVTVSDTEKDEHFVQLMDTSDDKVTCCRRISLDHSCEGIVCYKESTFYVVADNRICVYNTNGDLERKLFEENSVDIDMTDARIAISKDGNKIYLTIPTADEFITLDKDGRVLARFTDPEMKYPSGMCVSSDDTVFISGQNSDSIIQVAENGAKKLATVASEGDDMFQPLALTFDKKQSRLIVGLFSDELSVLGLAAATEHS